MGDSGRGPILGWGSERSGAGPARDPARRSIADRLAESWHIYRARWRPLLGIALLVQGTVGLPLVAISIGSVVQVLRLFSGDLPFPQPGAPAYAWTFGPFHDVILDYLVMGIAFGLGTLGLIVTFAATSVLLLDPAGDGAGAVSVIRTTLRRGREVILAGLVLTLGYGAVYWVQGLTFARASMYSPPFTSDGMAMAAITFLSLLVFAVECVAIYLMIRWIAAIPAVVVEGRSLGAALGRSSDLTRGRRLSVAGLLIVAGFVLGIVLVILEFGPAVLVGALLGWTSPALIGVLALLALAAQIVSMPFLATLLTVLFRDLRAAGPRPRLGPVDFPPGWGSGR